LLPIDAGLVDFPSRTLDVAATAKFGHGQVVADPSSGDADPEAAARQSSASSHGGANVVLVRSSDGRLLGLASPDAGLLRPQRLFSWAANATA
jgi:hypothetical protein